MIIYSQKVNQCLTPTIFYNKNTEIKIKKADKLSNTENDILKKLVLEYLSQYSSKNKENKVLKIEEFDSIKYKILPQSSIFYLETFVEGKNKQYAFNVLLKNHIKETLKKITIQSSDINNFNSDIKAFMEKMHNDDINFEQIIENYYVNKKQQDSTIFFKPNFTIFNIPKYVQKNKMYKISITMRDCDGSTIKNQHVKLSTNKGILDSNIITTDKYGNASVNFLTENKGEHALFLNFEYNDVTGKKVNENKTFRFNCIDENIMLKAFFNININNYSKKFISNNKYEETNENNSYDFAVFLNLNYENFMKIVHNEDSLLSKDEIENMIIGSNVLDYNNISKKHSELDKDLDFNQMAIKQNIRKDLVTNDTTRKLIAKTDTMLVIKYNYISTKIIPYKKENETDYSYLLKMENDLLDQVKNENNLNKIPNYLFFTNPLKRASNEFTEIITPVNFSNTQIFENFIEYDNKARSFVLNGAYYLKNKNLEINQSAVVQIKIIKLE